MTTEQYKKKYNPLIKPWSIEEEIGSGSFGKVFEIRREELGTVYNAALKIITIPQNEEQRQSVIQSLGLTEENATSYFREMVNDLTKEISLMAELQGNTNIVSYLDHRIIKYKDKLQWDILIRMELLTPFKAYSKSRKITEEDVIKLGKDICNALILCGRKKIVHRDIKPENIFISDTGSFKLGDFGVARVIEKTTGASTKVGTYDYMAPEVYRGDNYDNTADIYSLGLVMYRLLNGDRLPFLPPAPQSITYSERNEANNKRMKGVLFPAPAYASAKITDIILKACAFRPKERYSSPELMLFELEMLTSGKVMDKENADEIFVDKSTSNQANNSNKYSLNMSDNKNLFSSDDLEKKTNNKNSFITLVENSYEVKEGSAIIENVKFDENYDHSSHSSKRKLKVIIGIVIVFTILSLTMLGLYIIKGNYFESRSADNNVIATDNIEEHTDENIDGNGNDNSDEIVDGSLINEETELESFSINSEVLDLIDKNYGLLQDEYNVAGYYEGGAEYYIDIEELHAKIAFQIDDGGDLSWFDNEHPIPPMNRSDKVDRIMMSAWNITGGKLNGKVRIKEFADKMEVPNIKRISDKQVEILNSGGSRYYVSGETYAQIRLTPKSYDEDRSLYMQVGLDEDDYVYADTAVWIDRYKYSNWEEDDEEQDGWSEWVESLPSDVTSEEYDIEEKKQYSYRKATENYKTNGYGEWSEYKNTDDKTIIDKYAADEETEIEYSVKSENKQHFLWHNCGYNKDGELGSWYKETSRTTHHELGWVDDDELKNNFEVALSGDGWDFYTGTDASRSGHIFNDPEEPIIEGPLCEDGVWGWYCSHKNDRVHTVYSYRIRDIVRDKETTWSEWSEYSDSSIEADDLHEVREKTLYRYKRK